MPKLGFVVITYVEMTKINRNSGFNRSEKETNWDNPL